MIGHAEVCYATVDCGVNGSLQSRHGLNRHLRWRQLVSLMLGLPGQGARPDRAADAARAALADEVIE